ncbi:MAG: hypothetical protein ACSHYA_17020 [Opitutaceae bacterium]
MKRIYLLAATACLAAPLSHAQLSKDIGSADLSDWSGVAKVADNAAVITSGNAISYTYSNQNRVYPGLMRDFFGDAADWYDYAGVTLDIYLEKDSTAQLSVAMKVDPLDFQNLNPISTATLQLAGQGWQQVYIPWKLFDIDMGQLGNKLQAIKELEITATSSDQATLKIRDVEVTKGEVLALDSTIQGKSNSAGESVVYEVSVGNTTDTTQAVQLLVERLGWESMSATIEPSSLRLEPGATANCKLTVNLPASLPSGIRENQIVRVIPNGDGSATESIEFTTAVAVPTPNIVFTEDKWQEVREKVANYDWAKDSLAEYEKTASNWEVPTGKEIDLENPHAVSIFQKKDSDKLYACGIAYQVTGKKEYAEKCVQLFRRLNRDGDGYLATHRGGDRSFVGEGVFFQGLTRAYDMVRDSGLMTPDDHERMEKTLRLYIERSIKGNTRGAISNWNVAELTAAVYGALALQDWHLVDDLLNSPTGIYAQIYHGVMGDGWWYECAVGYNTWVASEFSEIAIALQPWGINLKDRQFQIGTTSHFSLQASRRVKGLHGMAFEKWGTISDNSVGIKDMWDAVVPFLDYRGVILAVNDAQESFVTGKPYELAYYLYRDPEYAAIINRGEKRHLLYGVPNLPEVNSVEMTTSAYADNMGIVQLRSQTPDREQREQIQAALHYGSHGGHHGHFDRTGLVHLARYGRSFYNPEMFWYGYGSYLYKFLVQTSINKNMVVVDQKMQEPVESFRTFYYTGDMLQATVVETDARWSHPPYGGMIYSGKEDFTFKDQSEEENRSLYVPEDGPTLGDCTEFTEPVLQRRLMIMMDDYVILADYLNAEQEHTFDWLINIKGFYDISGENLEHIRHDGQMSKDPLGAAQFVTDCNWYTTTDTVRTKYKTLWGKGADNKGARMPNSEHGPLKMDVFNAWPKQNELMIGTAPESFSVNKRVAYSVAADGETLLDESTGAWILGAKNIELDIAGKQALVLTTQTEKPRNNTIFWGDARVVLKDGTEHFIHSLPVTYENIRLPKSQGLDYYGGPVKIEGVQMDDSLAGMPSDTGKSGSITVDLSDLDVVSFKATLGGDFPMGDETQRRKTMAVRSTGKQARYLSVIEPYETESVIESVTAQSSNELLVKLIDGRTQKITISGLASNNVKITVQETKGGKLLREETTK